MLAKFTLVIKVNSPSRVAMLTRKKGLPVIQITASHTFVSFLPKYFNYQPVKIGALKKAGNRISTNFR